MCKEVHQQVHPNLFNVGPLPCSVLNIPFPKVQIIKRRSKYTKEAKIKVIIADRQEKEQTMVCLVVADMIRHHEVIFGGARYDNPDSINRRFINFPTLNPKGKRKVKPPPPPAMLPLSKSPLKTRSIFFY